MGPSFLPRHMLDTVALPPHEHLWNFFCCMYLQSFFMNLLLMWCFSKKLHHFSKSSPSAARKLVHFIMTEIGIKCLFIDCLKKQKCSILHDIFVSLCSVLKHAESPHGMKPDVRCVFGLFLYTITQINVFVHAKFYDPSFTNVIVVGIWSRSPNFEEMQQIRPYLRHEVWKLHSVQCEPALITIVEMDRAKCVCTF